MKKFKKNDLLSICTEECAEVVQAISKIQRFGWDNKNPIDPNSITNRDHLIEEMGDLMCMIGLVIQEYNLNQSKLETAVKAKLKKLEKWSGYKFTDKSDEF
jgi:NTP pyrophosphatase (non-canonical NTP hydrolase)